MFERKFCTFLFGQVWRQLERAKFIACLSLAENLERFSLARVYFPDYVYTSRRYDRRYLRLASRRISERQPRSVHRFSVQEATVTLTKKVKVNPQMAEASARAHRVRRNCSHVHYEMRRFTVVVVGLMRKAFLPWDSEVYDRKRMLLLDTIDAANISCKSAKNRSTLPHSYAKICFTRIFPNLLNTRTASPISWRRICGADVICFLRVTVYNVAIMQENLISFLKIKKCENFSETNDINAR